MAIYRMVRRAKLGWTRSPHRRVHNGNSPRHAPAGTLDHDGAIQIAFGDLKLKLDELKTVLPSFNTTPS